MSTSLSSRFATWAVFVPVIGCSVATSEPNDSVQQDAVKPSVACEFDAPGTGSTDTGECPSPSPLVECGGLLGVECAPGFECLDVEDDDCDPNSGGADCTGYCSAVEYCAGLLGLECSPGRVCRDLPDDDCDPDTGGADCIGICVSPPKHEASK